MPLLSGSTLLVFITACGEMCCCLYFAQEDVNKEIESFLFVFFLRIKRLQIYTVIVDSHSIFGKVFG